MTDRHSQRSRSWSRLAAALILAHFGLTLWMACRLQVWYDDFIVYCIGGLSLVDPTVMFPANIGPLLPLIYAPFMFSYGDSPIGLPYRGPHIVGALFTGGFMWVSWLLLRRCLNRFWAVYGLVPLVFCFLIVHYSPFPGHDFAGAALFWLTGLTYLRLRSRHDLRTYIILGCLSMLTIMARYNLGLIIPAIFLNEIALLLFRRDADARRHLRSPRFWALAGLLPILLAVCANGLVVGVGRDSMQGAFGQIFSYFGSISSGYLPEAETDVWFEYFVTLPGIVSVPVTLIAVLGLVRMLRGRLRTGERFILIAAALPAAHLVFLFPHKESRFMIPCMIAIMLCFAKGAQLLVFRMTRRGNAKVNAGGSAKVAGQLLLVALVAYPVVRGVREWLSFCNPLYTTPYVRDVCDYIRREVPPEQALLATQGTLHLYPDRGELRQYDEAYKAFSLSYRSLFFLSGRKMNTLREDKDTSVADTFWHLSEDQRVFARFPNETRLGSRKSEPEQASAIAFYTFRRAVLARTDGPAETWEYISPNGHRIRISKDGSGTIVARPSNSAGGFFFMETPGGGRHHLVHEQRDANNFTFTAWPAAPPAELLLAYQTVDVFPAP